MAFIACYFPPMMSWFLIDGVCESWIMRPPVWWLSAIFPLDRYHPPSSGTLNIHLSILCCYSRCRSLWYSHAYNTRWPTWRLTSSITRLANFDHWCHLTYSNCTFFSILYIRDRETISKDSINRVNPPPFERFRHTHVCTTWREYQCCNFILLKCKGSTKH